MYKNLQQRTIGGNIEVHKLQSLVSPAYNLITCKIAPAETTTCTTASEMAPDSNDSERKSMYLPALFCPIISQVSTKTCMCCIILKLCNSKASHFLFGFIQNQLRLRSLCRIPCWKSMLVLPWQVTLPHWFLFSFASQPHTPAMLDLTMIYFWLTS